ncbi:MAG TPA: GGDEF domain-containing protein [Polyangiaceae bacterium]|jgi:diguanylate cyclase (GGDEF)-like protein
MTDDTKTQKLPMMSSEPPPRSSGRPSVTEWSEEEVSTRTTDHAIAVVPPSGPLSHRTRAVVTVVSGPSTGRAFAVPPDASQMVIGRGKECDVRLDDSGASRTHARIVPVAGGTYAIEDMGSTNGTFVDGRKVERAELKSGDRIHIGPNIIVSFSIVDAQAEKVVQQLYESSVRDPLTRIFNRRYLVERLASEVAYAKRHGTKLSLILFDLDLFKRVNDTYGHLVGDEVLREVSALVQRLVRAEDVFARFGGEEFVLLVRGIEHVNVGRFAERIRTAVAKLEIAADTLVVMVTVSLGFASLGELPEAEREQSGLLGLADERLYKAKTAGRNQVCGS